MIKKNTHWCSRLRAKKGPAPPPPPPPREFRRHILSWRKFQAASFKRRLHSVQNSVKYINSRTDSVRGQCGLNQIYCSNLLLAKLKRGWFPKLCNVQSNPIDWPRLTGPAKTSIRHWSTVVRLKSKPCWVYNHACRLSHNMHNTHALSYNVAVWKWNNAMQYYL